MSTFSALLLSAILLTFLGGCENRPLAITHEIKPECEYYSLKSAQCLDEAQMLRALEAYKVIFIGDHHSEEMLHRKVASLITSLSDSGITVHLANEWFSPEDNSVLEDFCANRIDEKTFIKDILWDKRLKAYSYDSFRPMYEAVKKGKGKLYGINLTPQARKKISDQNLSAMGQDERLFNDGLDINVSVHRQLLMPYFNHCHAPKPDETPAECAQRMYRVQVAWDSKMALETHRLVQGLQKNEKLIVFAGAMHIENGLGIPLRFSRLDTTPALSIVPLDEQSKEAPNGLADYVLLYRQKSEP